MTSSPYKGIPEDQWMNITKNLVANFPLSPQNITDIVHTAWEDIYSSSFGGANLKIGTDIFLPAQATGIIIEKLIAVHLHNTNPLWRGGISKTEKDIINTQDDHFSFEIKTSSSKNGLYGNRSTGHQSDYRTKNRAGYYLVVNYKLPKEDHTIHYIRKIRFGWIDDEDWIGQLKPTGQQASIGAKLARLKLITLFSHS